jgi:hypothetical protein
VTARLARRFGGVPESPQVTPAPLRDLEAIAIENVAEGCVRETYGALVGRWQALRAADLRVRHAYAQIAEDELRHAALAWRIAGWIAPRLHARARCRADDARRQAVADLQRELAVEVSDDLRVRCGVPSAREGLALFGRLSATLA